MLKSGRVMSLSSPMIRSTACTSSPASTSAIQHRVAQHESLLLLNNIGPGLLKFVSLMELDKAPTLKLPQGLQICPLINTYLDRRALRHRNASYGARFSIGAIR